MNLLMIICALIPTLVTSRSAWYPRPTFYYCQKSGVKCISEDAFTYCTKHAQIIIIELDHLKCPKGYLCQENSQYPCVKDPERDNISNDCNESSESVEINTTSVSSNTEENTTTISQDDHSQDLNDDDVVQTESEPFTTTAAISTKKQYHTEDEDFHDSTNNCVQQSDIELSTSAISDSTNHVEEDHLSTASQTLAVGGDQEETFVTEPFLSTVASEEVNVTILPIGDSSSYREDDNVSNANSQTATNGESEHLNTRADVIEDINEADNDFVVNSAADNSRKSNNVPPSKCKDGEFFPGPTCNQYYVCQTYWLFWSRPVLDSCEEGYSFNVAKSSCVASSESDCID